MAPDCSNCGGLLCTSDVRPSLGVAWFCAWCGMAGEYAVAKSTSGRTVRARIMTIAGDPGQHKPWVDAQSVPYAQRVAVDRRDS